MTNKLKPCPFCGGEAVLHPFFGGRYMATCKKCCTTMPIHDTYEEAIAAWNTRAERECRLRGGECDQCGAIVHEHANLYWKPVEGGMRTVECRDVHYCPNCGAKVVEE